jgi:hypothetical protein
MTVCDLGCASSVVCAERFRTVAKSFTTSAHTPAVMIGCFPVRRRVKLRPEVVLWRGVVLELGQVLAHLRHWDACPAGGRA